LPHAAPRFQHTIAQLEEEYVAAVLQLFIIADVLNDTESHGFDPEDDDATPQNDQLLNETTYVNDGDTADLLILMTHGAVHSYFGGLVEEEL
jgi:hypothetical protein